MLAETLIDYVARAKDILARLWRLRNETDGRMLYSLYSSRYNEEARLLAIWGYFYLPIRGMIAADEAVAMSLVLEPRATGVGDPQGTALVPRYWLTKFMADSKDLTFWTVGKNSLRNGLIKAITTDPNIFVRLEAVRAVGRAPLPLSWVQPLLDAMKEAEAGLRFPLDTLRWGLAAHVFQQKLQEVQGKLTSMLAQEASGFLKTVGQGPGGSGPVVPGFTDTVKVPKPPGAGFDWKPWLLSGAAALAAAIAAVAWTRRQARVGMLPN